MSAERRYIRAAISFVECDEAGIPLSGAAVVERHDWMAIDATELAFARFPELVWSNRATHCAQYVMMRPGVEDTASAFGKLMAKGHVNAVTSSND